MRTIPASIINALKSPDLPIAREVLLYRRVWSDALSKYVLESTPVDITEWVQSYGKVKLKLDVTEIDKWETSNLTLTFSNDFNRFKEARAGGLFATSVIYGSKIVYRIRPKDTALTDAVAVFTGFIYTAPVYRDNGNTVDITVTSDLKALEYISAESLCTTSTDIECAVISDTENKEYRTPETGIGFVDAVKYGADLGTATTLILGTDYEVNDLNQYDLGAKITLKLTHVSGHKLFADYRYWFKDMTIDNIVIMLLGLAGIEDYIVSRPIYPNADVKVFEKNIYDAAIMWHVKHSKVNDIDTLESFTLGSSPWNRRALSNLISGIPFLSYFPVSIASKGLYFHTFGSSDVGTAWGFVDDDKKGIVCRHRYSGGSYIQELALFDNGTYTVLYTASSGIFGFAIDGNSDLWAYIGAYSGIPITRVNLGPCPIEFNPTQALIYAQAVDATNSYEISGYYREDIPEDITNSSGADFVTRYLQNAAQTFGTMPCARFDFHNTSEYFKSWGSFSCDIRQSGSGIVKFYWSDSDDGITYGPMTEITAGASIGSTKPYLRFYVRTESAYPNFCYVDRLKVWAFAEGANVPLVNFTGLSVSDAVQALAKLVAFEIGLNQDGTFFFRPRTGEQTDTELNGAEISELPRAFEDLDGLYNKISVKFGNYQTVVSDVTENAPAPNSISKYGERTKDVQSENFLPADNVDISRAVGLLNYAAFKGITRRFDAEAKFNAALELGDIITLSLDNANFCDPADTNRRKSATLTAWGVSCKILGLEIDLDKRLMTLDLKEIISDYTNALLAGTNKVLFAGTSNYIKYR